MNCRQALKISMRPLLFKTKGTKKMKICIDLEVLQSNHTKRGIGRYCTSLMKEILSAIEGHDIHILLNGQLENIADIKRIFQGYECVKSFEIWYAPLFAIGIENEKERKTKCGLDQKIHCNEHKA